MINETCSLLNSFFSKTIFIYLYKMNVCNLLLLLASILVISAVIVIFSRELFISNKAIRKSEDIKEEDNEIIGYIYPSRAGSLQASAKSSYRPHTILYRYPPYMKKIN